MNWPVFWAAIAAFAALAAIGWDALKVVFRHGRSAPDVVVQSATELVEQYRKDTADLRAQLAAANHSASELGAKLTAAETRVDDLTNQLADAQAQVRLLNLQVKTMSEQLPREGA